MILFTICKLLETFKVSLANLFKVKIILKLLLKDEANTNSRIVAANLAATIRAASDECLFFHVAADVYLALMVAQGRDNTCPAAGRLNRALPGIPR